jgi:hypothetical protein
MNSTKPNRARVWTLALATTASLAAAAQDTGRVLVTVGICEQSNAEFPVLWFRKVDKSADFSARGASFGAWDYSDQTGKFRVTTKMLPAGEWEMYRFEMKTKTKEGAFGNSFTHRPRNDFSHRFTVAPGKLVDLGRYCAGTQSVGEKYPDSDRIWNQIVRLVYMHVSASRPVDVEAALAGEGAMLTLVPARPDPPERVSQTLRSTFIEPRVIAKPAQGSTPPSPNPFR